MFARGQRIRIAGTGSHVPERIVKNLELEHRANTKDQWVREKLGVEERRVVAGGELTSDLASKAGLRAIEAAGIDKNDVGLVILATATPDRKAPSTACIAKEKMGIFNHAPAFDLAAVCSGFLYGIAIGGNAIETGSADNVLVIGADTFSSITDWDRRDCVFFGDGAGAVILQPSKHASALFSCYLCSDVAGVNAFTVYPGDDYFTMDGHAVFQTGTEVLPKAILHVLDQNNLKPEDITAIIPHQPSIRILQETAARLGIPFDRVKTNMQRYANTSGATIPLLLDEVARSGSMNQGDLTVFAAVGSGWTYGAALYRWH